MVLSGLSFNKISDWSFDPRYPVTFNYNKLQDGDIVFLNFDYFLEFFYDISNKQNKKKFILISHNSDNSFTDEHYNMIKDYVYRVYAINNVCNNDNVVTIPLGFQDYPSNHFKLIVEMLLKSKKIEKKHLLYMNFSIHTNLTKRKECFETFKNYIKKVFLEVSSFRISHTSYVNFMISNKNYKLMKSKDCICFYSFLYATYGKKLRKIRNKKAIFLTMQKHFMSSTMEIIENENF